MYFVIILFALIVYFVVLFVAMCDADEKSLDITKQLAGMEQVSTGWNHSNKREFMISK